MSEATKVQVSGYEVDLATVPAWISIVFADDNYLWERVPGRPGDHWAGYKIEADWGEFVS